MKNRTAFNLYVCAWFGLGYWLRANDVPMWAVIMAGAAAGILNGIMHDMANKKKESR